MSLTSSINKVMRAVARAGLAVLVLPVAMIVLVSGPAGATTTAMTAPLSGLNPPANANDPLVIFGQGGASVSGTETCTAAGWCVAVGSYVDTSGNRQGLIETLSDGTWTATTAPLAGLSPASGTDAFVELSSVSCPATGSCVAVGNYDDGSGNTFGVFETLSGGTWTAQSAPLTGLSPSAGTDPQVAFGANDGVSCAAPGSCVAVGDYTDTSLNSYGLIETLSGGVWSVQEAPMSGLSPGPATNPNANLYTVACPATDSCVAVGDYDDTPTSSQGLIETLSGGVWSATTAPLSGLSPAGTGGFLNSLSCPAPGSCEAMGAYGSTSTNQGLIETLSGSSWTAQTEPLSGLSPGANAIPNVLLGDLTCSAVGSCVAVQEYTDSSGNRQGMIESLSGGTWAPTTLPLGSLSPAPGSDPQFLPGGVSCAVAGSCVVVGTYHDGSGNEQGLIGTLSAGTWSVGTAPVTGLDPATANGSSLGDVACATSGACVAVGVYQTAPSIQYGLFESLGVSGGGTSGSGYRLSGSDGGVFAFGNDGYYGSLPALGIHVGNIVSIAATPDEGGYWLVGSDGGIFAFGDAGYHGSVPGFGIHVGNIVGMAATSDGGGYWLVGSDGGIFAFGDAPYKGSLPGLGISVGNVVGIAGTPDHGGYWLVGSDGGIFAFGDAGYHGSVPGFGIHVGNVVGVAATSDGGGYWLVGSDGGIFAFGDAPYQGSLPGLGISVGNVVGLAGAPDGGGYWMVGTDGGVFAFGSAAFHGSLPGLGIHVGNIKGMAR